LGVPGNKALFQQKRTAANWNPFDESHTVKQDFKGWDDFDPGSTGRIGPEVGIEELNFGKFS
jgi:hypothetical protein